MERTVVIVNAKNKREAIVSLEMALEAVKERYTENSNEVSERVCITNEGSISQQRGGCRDDGLHAM